MSGGIYEFNGNLYHGDGREVERMEKPMSELTKKREARIREAVAFGETQRTGKWFVADLADLLSEIDRLRAALAAKEQELSSMKLAHVHPSIRWASKQMWNYVMGSDVKSATVVEVTAAIAAKERELREAANTLLQRERECDVYCDQRDEAIEACAKLEQQLREAQAENIELNDCYKRTRLALAAKAEQAEDFKALLCRDYDGQDEFVSAARIVLMKHGIRVQGHIYGAGNNCLKCGDHRGWEADGATQCRFDEKALATLNPEKYTTHKPECSYWTTNVCDCGMKSGG